MWQIEIDQAAFVPVSYEEKDLPASFRAFKPILFKEGPLYCCLLGPDAKHGIFGFGQTAADAMVVWDLELKKRLLHHNREDRIAKFLLHKISRLKQNHVS